MHKYTDEEKKFLTEFVFGHSYREIQEAFNNKFNISISLSMIKGYIRNHKLNTGRTGHFPKGNIPHNKCVKGISYPGMEKTQFKPGNIPANHKPVGSERITKDGYIEIKVSEPNKWKLKHRVIWEESNGKIPNSHAIVFKDQNKLNVSLNNLILVSRSELVRLNQNKLLYPNSELTQVGINIAKLMVKLSERKKE